MRVLVYHHRLLLQKKKKQVFRNGIEVLYPQKRRDKGHTFRDVYLATLDRSTPEWAVSGVFMK